MTSSDLVINELFFKQLWPLILEENICDTYSKHTSKFFEPKKPFDSLWAHEFLSSKGYGEYEPPITFYYPPCPDRVCERASDSSQRSTPIEHLKGGHCALKFNRIPSLEEQFAEIEKKRKCQQKLIDDFKNRSIPWYMPSSPSETSIVSDLQLVFTKPFERQLLNAILVFECTFMIINVGADFCISEVEGWLKFCKYLKIIFIVRHENVAAQLSRLSPSFFALVFEDICENTWQQELTRALNTAVDYAVEANIMTHCAMAFVYVFSSQCDMNFLNKFRILRKN